MIRSINHDPTQWMEEGCGWKLWDKQREIARAVFNHERVAVPAAFGVGKTYVAARIALAFLYNNYPAKVITTAPTARQVTDLLWSEVRTAHKKSIRRLPRDPLKTRLELDEDWYMVGFTTGDEEIDKFTGYHSSNVLVIFDQACGISRTMWEAAEGLMTSNNCHWLAISNTTDDQSAMADICISDRKHSFGDWEIIHIPAQISPNVVAGKDLYHGLISHKWLEKKRKVWSIEDPLWQIFVEAQFVSASAMTILTHTMIKELFSRRLKPDFKRIEIGLDVADEGVDSTVWFVHAGGRLLFIERVTGNDPMQVVKATTKLWKKVKKLTGHVPIDIKIDNIGIGRGVETRLIELGYPVTGINVAMSPDDTEQFLNSRAEIAWGVRSLAEARKLSFIPYYSTPDEYIDSLREELGIRYQFSSTGKIQLEPKDKIRKRMKRSPDYWDAMMLGVCDESSAVRISLLGNESTSEEEKDTDANKDKKDDKYKEDMDKMTGKVIDLDKDFVEVE